MDEYRVRQFEDGFFAIEETNVRSFLLVGKERALLIDCGCEITNMKHIVSELTNLPLIVGVTHADDDHIRCCDQFKTIYMSPNEYANYHHHTGRNTNLRPLWDGDVIELGGRDVQVIYNPGHTSGSLTFLDRKKHLLVGGDSIQTGTVFLFGEERDLLAYLHTMERISSMRQYFEWVYPAHGECPVPASVIPRLVQGIREILNGEIRGVSEVYLDKPIRVYDIGVAKILYEAKREFFE